MVDRWGAQHEPRNVGNDLFPAVMLDNLSNVPRMLVFGVIRCPLLVEDQLCVGNSSGPDLERLAHELVLSINLCDGTISVKCKHYILYCYTSP